MIRCNIVALECNEETLHRKSHMMDHRLTDAALNNVAMGHAAMHPHRQEQSFKTNSNHKGFQSDHVYASVHEVCSPHVEQRMRPTESYHRDSLMPYRCRRPTDVTPHRGLAYHSRCATTAFTSLAPAGTLSLHKHPLDRVPTTLLSTPSRPAYLPSPLRLTRIALITIPKPMLSKAVTAAHYTVGANRASSAQICHA